MWQHLELKSISWAGPRALGAARCGAASAAGRVTARANCCASKLLQTATHLPTAPPQGRPAWGPRGPRRASYARAPGRTPFPRFRVLKRATAPATALHAHAPASARAAAAHVLSHDHTRGRTRARGARMHAMLARARAWSRPLQHAGRAPAGRAAAQHSITDARAARPRLPKRPLRNPRLLAPPVSPHPPAAAARSPAGGHALPRRAGRPLPCHCRGARCPGHARRPARSKASRRRGPPAPFLRAARAGGTLCRLTGALYQGCAAGGPLPAPCRVR